MVPLVTPASFPIDAPGPRIALVAGATGLVGAELVRLLLARPGFDRVVALVRRRPRMDHPGLDARVVAFDRLGAEETAGASDAFCALGTTLAKAGSPAAFRKVDLDAVEAFARFARRGGAARFALVSSVGASAESRNLYLRTKGEAEEAVRTLAFPSLVIVRPGLLLGDRRESRPAEAAARLALPFLNPVLMGSLRRYRAVPAAHVAAAMVRACLAARPGSWVLEYDEIERLARNGES